MSEKDNKGGLVKLSEKLGFCAFSTSTNIAFNFKSAYYLTFLTMIVGIDVDIAATMLALGTVWDAINDPLIATFCANHKFKNGERVRPYALWMSVPFALCLVLLFVNFGISNDYVAAAIALAIYFVFEGVYTFICMPYNALASLSSPFDEDRKSINAYRSLGGVLGTVVGFVCPLLIIQMFGGLKDHKVLNASDTTPILLTAILIGSLVVLGSLCLYFFGKERIKDKEDVKEEKVNLIKTYKVLFSCKSWVFNMFYILCYGVSQAFIMNNINYYAAFVKHDSNYALMVEVAYIIMAILTSFLAPMIDKKLGRKNGMYVAIAVLVLGKVPFIINPYTDFSIYTNAITVGYGLTYTFVMFNTNRNNIADIIEIKNGRRLDTLIAGGDNLISKLAEALAIFIMGKVLAGQGFNAELADQPLSAINALNGFLGWIPALVTLAMVIFVTFMNIPKEMAEVKAKAGIKD